MQKALQLFMMWLATLGVDRSMAGEPLSFTYEKGKPTAETPVRTHEATIPALGGEVFIYGSFKPLSDNPAPDGYHKALTEEKKKIEAAFPRDSIINFKEIDFNHVSAVDRTSKIVNLQQQILETNNITTCVTENTKHTIKYFEGKKYLEPNIIKKMKRK